MQMDRRVIVNNSDDADYDGATLYMRSSDMLIRHLVAALVV